MPWDQPLDPQGLGNYALFLYRVSKDFEQSEEYFRKVSLVSSIADSP